LEEDLEKINVEVTEWIKTAKSGFIYTVTGFLNEHGLKSEEIDVRDVLIEPKPMKSKRKRNLFLNCFRKKESHKKQSVWGLFKNFLQGDERELPSPQEPETEEDEQKRIRKLDLG